MQLLTQTLKEHTLRYTTKLGIRIIISEVAAGKCVQYRF